MSCVPRRGPHAAARLLCATYLTQALLGPSSLVVRGIKPVTLVEKTKTTTKLAKEEIEPVTLVHKKTTKLESSAEGKAEKRKAEENKAEIKKKATKEKKAEEGADAEEKAEEKLEEKAEEKAEAEEGNEASAEEEVEEKADAEEGNEASAEEDAESENQAWRVAAKQERVDKVKARRMMSKEAIEERSRKTKAQFKSSRHFCYWTEDTYFKEEDAAGKHQRRGTLEELTTKAAYELYKEVPTVTADDLAALVTKKKAAVVVFFATWCPFCTKVVEEGQDDDTPAPYSEFWGEVHDDDLLKDKLEVVKYDASNTEDLEKVPKEFGQIKFFPNVKGLTADGKLKEFDNDPRSSDELFEFGKAVAGEAQGPSMKVTLTMTGRKMTGKK